MAQLTITQLPQAQPLAGTESVPISQNGLTVQTTVAAIANSPTQQQTFITVNQEVTLPNSRRLQGGTGVGLTDTGALGSISITLNGASGSLEASTVGLIAKTSGSTVVGRTITGSATGVAVSDGNGVGGNPVISLTGPVGTINGLGGSGLLALQNGTAVGAISIQGTASQIDVANGNGLLGSPTISIASNPTIPGTGGMVVPSGTTAQRGAAINGTIRYNTDTSQFEIYDNGWGNLPAGAVSSVDVSGGATGLTTSGGPIISSGVITLGGTLLTSSGGTGLTTYAAGDLPYYASGTAFNKLAIGMAGQVLTSSGSAPQYVDQSTLAVGTATNIAGGAANRIPVNAGAGATSFIVAPTLGNTFLEWSGSAFQWSSNPLGTVTSVDASGGTTGFTFTGGPITSSGTLTLGGTLNVLNGGTGVTTLTGYVKGNGISPMTASATIPNTDITGLGSMSTQSASSVAITGGAINGTTIGGTTPAAGTFTSVAMTSGTITTAPTNGNDIVNKTYADSIATGINFHQAVKYATTGALPASTYNNGASGVGATITGNSNGALTVDGYTFTSPADNGTRILVKNQANAAYNGVYTLTQAGSAGAPFILTRATDFNTPGSGVNQIDAGDFFLVTAGTANANTSWVQQTPLPITMGTTAIVFAQFGAPITYTAGTGLSESPTYTFNIANTGVTAGNYGGAATAVTLSINAQGQITSAADAPIAIAATQITSGTIDSARLSGAYSGITGVNTLTSGTWNATTIAVGYGGTGLTTYTAGDLIYASGTATLSKLGLGTSGQVLTAGASAPVYVNQSTLSVGSATTATTAGSVTNSVTFNNSGTGDASGTSFNGSAARTISYNTVGAPSTSGTNATGTWGISISGNAATATSATTATTATSATNVAGGAANRIVYQTGAGATSFIVAPTISSTYLQWNGSAFVWSSAGVGSVTSVDVSGGTTGLTFSGGPITSSGTITMAGTLGIANGGTNATATPTAGAIAYGTGTAYGFSLAGTSGQVLTSAGTSAPTWTNQGSLSVGTATNIAGGTAGAVPYNSAAGTTTFLSLGTSGQVLTAGASAPQYVNQSTLSVGSATTATNLAGGALGSLPYQSAAGTTLFVSGNTTTTPQFLTSTGTGAAAQAPTLTGSTGSGSVVLATSPTLVTPNLGTPSALVGTNITGTASGLSIGGNAATATTATNATNTAITANSANATNYLTFVSATTGNLGQLVNSAITCNPSTGAITGGISGGTF